MTGLKPLAKTPERLHGNTILFKLAEALGYEKTPRFEEKFVTNVIHAEPDRVLDEALEIIWRYRGLEK